MVLATDRYFSKQEILNLVNTLPQEQIREGVAHKDSVLWQYNNMRTERGDRLDFASRPYLVQIASDFHPHIAAQKAAQVGFTMLSIGKVLFVADVYGRTIIYTFPTAGDVYEFSKGRFSPIVRSSRYLQTRMRDYDNAGMKRIGKATIYFKGTFKERQGISVPSDVNVHDELDFSDPSVREVYSSRLDASSWIFKGKLQEGWEWDFSTPTIPDYGINRLFKDSDQHVWRVKCPRCNRSQQVDFFKNMRQTKYKERFFYGCRKCDKELNRMKGVWSPKYSKRSIRGYHIPQTICPWISAGRLHKLYRESRKSAQKLKKFYNFNLALPYESGEDRLTRDLILSKVVPGTLEKGTIYLGADQGDTIHIEVTKIDESGRRRIIFLGTVYSFNDLGQIIEHFRPRIAVIDALPNHQQARAMAANLHNVYLCYYGGKKKLEKEDWKSDLEDKEVHIPRTELLDHTAHLWNSNQTFIEDYISRTTIEDFAVQMSNMKRDIDEKTSGEQVAVWKATGPDHYRHADGYNWIASEIGNNSYSGLVAASKPEEHISLNEHLFGADEVW